MRRIALFVLAVCASTQVNAQYYDPYGAHHDGVLSRNAARSAHHEETIARHDAKVGDFRGAAVAQQRANQRAYEAHHYGVLSRHDSGY